MEKRNTVGAKVHFPNEDPKIPTETLWLEAEHWGMLYSLLDQTMIDRFMKEVTVDLYIHEQDNYKDEEYWSFKFRKTYIHPFYTPDYMFLVTSDHILRNNCDVTNRWCIHIPSGMKFHIFRRTSINFGQEIIDDKHNIFYKFKYIAENGMETPMIIHTCTKDVKSDEERKQIKYEILKNGAKWFCEHLQNGHDGHWVGDSLKFMY